GKSGGVFFLAADKVPTDDAVLLAATARAVLGGGRGSLTGQIDHPAAPPPPTPPPPLTPAAVATNPVAQAGRPPDGLSFWNGYGGFTGDGREYVIVIDGTSQSGPMLPPAPWTNVLANP